MSPEAKCQAAAESTRLPAAQKNRVKPFRNGVISFSSDHPGAAMINRAPASVVIATAPMLIQ